MSLVNIVIGNIESRIIGFIPDDVHKELDKTLSYKVAGIEYSQKVRDGHWDGYTRLYKKHKGQSFYTGLLSLVTDVLDKHNIEYRKVDKRVVPEINLANLTFTPPPMYEERDYQQFSIDRSKKKTRGVLKMATASGKTMTVCQLISEIKTGPFMFYVLTKELMDQAHDCLSSTLNVPIGRIGAGECDIQMINVCTIQTAIRAINAENKSFKISDYSFDEEDLTLWKESEVLSAEKQEMIRKVIYSTKGLYLDECIHGDTELITEQGKTKIKDIREKKCRFVLTYDGNSTLFKPITYWWDKGKKKTLKIKTSEGKEIICTDNHLIMTQRGWIKAGKVKTTDYLFIANADVEEKFCKQTNIDRNNSFSDIKLKKEQNKNGRKSIRNTFLPSHYVGADAAKEFYQNTKLLNPLLITREQKADMRNTLRGMTNNHVGKSITLNCLTKKKWQYMEHYSEIRPFLSLIHGQKMRDYHPTTVQDKWSGRYSNPNFYTGLGRNKGSLKTVDMETSSLTQEHGVCHVLPKYIDNFTSMEEKLYLMRFLMESEISDWHGGYVMTEACQPIQKEKTNHIYLYTQNLSQEMRTKKYVNGLTKMDMTVKYAKQENITTCLSPTNQHCKYQKKYPNTCLNVCDTSWHQISSIEPHTEENVYDIEVEDTHCFFANNILVHNCHHASANTVRDIITASPYAYWKYGGSATPYREDNADLMIQALFGKKIVDINASYLIERGFLCTPHILFWRFEHDCKLNAYKSIYKNCVVEHKEFNANIGNMASFLNEKGLSVLILVQQIKHGKLIQKHLPDVPLVTGKMTKKKRKEMIDKLRNKEIKCMIATSLADEGLDIPTLDCVIMAGGGSSSTRFNQRVGRTLRIDRKAENPRTTSIVIYFDHRVKYLHKHTVKAEKIVKEEKRFNIIKIKDIEQAKSAVEDVMGLEKSQKTLFD